MQDFYNTQPEEQETTILIDYYDRNVIAYTSKKSIYKRLLNKIGEPQTTYTTNGEISGGKWTIPFLEKKKLGALFSRPTLIANMK